MRFDQSFTVPAGPQQAFDALTDVSLVASCMPGVELADGGDGPRHAGTLRAKLGPISLTYRGEAWFEEVDPQARSFRMVAAATEAGGGGNAGATVLGHVEPDADGSRVDLDIELQIAGRPAQFGRGLITDVSRQMTDQFARQLAARLDGGEAGEEPVEVPDALSAWSLVPARAKQTGLALAALAVGLAVGGVVGWRWRGRAIHGEAEGG